MQIEIEVLVYFGGVVARTSKAEATTRSSGDGNGAITLSLSLSVFENWRFLAYYLKISLSKPFPFPLWSRGVAGAALGSGPAC